MNLCGSVCSWVLTTKVFRIRLVIFVLPFLLMAVCIRIGPDIVDSITMYTLISELPCKRFVSNPDFTRFPLSDELMSDIEAYGVRAVGPLEKKLLDKNCREDEDCRKEVLWMICEICTTGCARWSYDPKPLVDRLLSRKEAELRRSGIEIVWILAGSPMLSMEESKAYAVRVHNDPDEFVRYWAMAVLLKCWWNKHQPLESSV